VITSKCSSDILQIRTKDMQFHMAEFPLKLNCPD